MLFFAGIAVYALLVAAFQHSNRPEKKWEDLISQLPDEVLSSIIARLSAREAVKTSILSRRWRHLYKYTPQVRYPCCEMFDLRFVRDHEPKEYPALRQKFSKGLETLIQNHTGSKITSFDLSCSLDFFSKSCIDDLCNGLCSFDMEQLKLSYGCGQPVHSLPIVSCDLLSRLSSLKHLHLTRFTLDLNFAWQSTSLNILQLYHVRLASGVVESILSNCLSLQSLTMCHCYLPSKLSIQGSNLILESLMIHRCYFLEEIRLNATKLSTFEYCAGMKSSDIVFDHVPVLQNFSIGLYGNPTIPVVLGDLPQLKSLSLETSGTFYQALNTPFVTKTLGNLRELVLSSSIQLDSGLLNISMILNVCPFLENLRLWVCHYKTNGTTADGPGVERSIVEHHTRLKEVELSIFSGTKNEFDFALSILKTAAVLERMYIDNDEFLSWDEEKRKLFCNQLQEEAISRTAKVTMRMFPTSYLTKRSIFSAENCENQQIASSIGNSKTFDMIRTLVKQAMKTMELMAGFAVICAEFVILWRLECERNYRSMSGLEAVDIYDDNVNKFDEDDDIDETLISVFGLR